MSTLIVTMAGSSQRFRDAGVAAPKWALRAGGASLLEHAVTSMSEILDGGWRLILVALESHVGTVAWRKAVAGLPWNYDIVALPSTPPGQAYSALAAAAIVRQTEPIAIWNIDTMILPGAEPLARPDGNWITLTQATGDHWSFAELALDGTVIRTAEKQRISQHTSIGLYGVSSMKICAETVTRHESSRSSNTQESFVAPLYNHIVERGDYVSSILIPVERLVPLGTPAEVVASCRRLGWAVPDESVHAT